MLEEEGNEEEPFLVLFLLTFKIARKISTKYQHIYLAGSNHPKLLLLSRPSYCWKKIMKMKTGVHLQWYC